MSITTGTLPGVRIVDMPDLGAVTDTSSVVGEHAGSGRFSATALRDYLNLTFATDADLAAETAARAALVSPAMQPVVAAATIAIARNLMGVFPIVTPQQFGAVGDGVTDDTLAVQNAVATGQPVYIPPGTYFIKQAINCITEGQVIFGAGVWSSVIQVDTTFNMAASGVFALTSGEPAAHLRGFKIRFVQPDTAARSALTTYPPAIYAGNAPRFVLEDMEITNATVAVNMSGNSGGADIRGLRASFYTYGIVIDGSLDTVRITNMHCVGFEMTANQLSIAQSPGTTCIISGRCDDLKLSGCLFLFYLQVHLFLGGSGYTFGSATACSFDTFQGILQESGGRFSISDSYFSAGFAPNPGLPMIANSSGSLYVTNCWFGSGANEASATLPVVTNTAATGFSALLQMTNCDFEDGSADVTCVECTSSGGQSETLLSNNWFNRTAGASFSQPVIAVGPQAGTIISASNNRMSNAQGGIGVFFNVPGDNYHRIIGNGSSGWSNNFPTATLGVYQYN